MAYRNVATQEWGPPFRKEVIATWFSDWEPDLLSMLITDESSLKWAVETVGPLPSFVAENAHVALIGSAAHAMTPHLGLGIAQGIEDAYVLYRLFSHPDMAFATLSKAFKAFDQVRRPRAQEAATNSNNITNIFNFRKPSGDFFGEPFGGATLFEIGAVLGTICDPFKDENLCVDAGNRATEIFGTSQLPQ